MNPTLALPFAGEGTGNLRERGFLRLPLRGWEGAPPVAHKFGNSQRRSLEKLADKELLQKAHTRLARKNEAIEVGFDDL